MSAAPAVAAMGNHHANVPHGPLEKKWYLTVLPASYCCTPSRPHDHSLFTRCDTPRHRTVSNLHIVDDNPLQNTSEQATLILPDGKK